MYFYYNAQNSPIWGKIPVTENSQAFSAPSMVQRSSGETDIAVQGPNHSLQLYINNVGNPEWGHLQAAGENTTFNDTNPPAILLRPSGELDIAVHGPENQALVYYNAQGQQQWGETLAAIPGYANREPAMIQRPTGETDLIIVGPNSRLDYYMNDQNSPLWGVLPVQGNNSAY
ncbi:MAG: hypothetical protein ABWX94_03465 [Candidatus Saccharimonadales bacterium]